MIRLAENRYGKHRVRVVRVKRSQAMHRFEEWNVEVLLTGDFATCFEVGDNSRIMATDSMKNTVYSLAKDSAATTIEEFALELTEYLLETNPQIDSAIVSVSNVPWKHIEIDGVPSPSAFLKEGGEIETATVRRTRDQRASISSGLENLVIMKTSRSGFEGFIRDVHTTLPETADRLFGTAVRSRWSYRQQSVDFQKARDVVRSALLRVFSVHESKSVQHTLYAMGQAALEAAREISEIELTMPNKHCLLVDLARFGKTNENEIFVPTEEPYGYIEATIRRDD